MKCCGTDLNPQSHPLEIVYETGIKKLKAINKGKKMIRSFEGIYMIL